MNEFTRAASTCAAEVPMDSNVCCCAHRVSLSSAPPRPACLLLPEKNMHRAARQERRAVRDLARGNAVGAAVHHAAAVNIASHHGGFHGPAFHGHGANIIHRGHHYHHGHRHGHHHHHHHHHHHGGGLIAGAAAVAAGAALATAVSSGPSHASVSTVPIAPVYMSRPTSAPVAGAAPVLMQGWLVKQAVSAPSLLKNWKRRFVSLLSNRIEWRRSPNEPPAGSLPLAPTTLVAVPQEWTNCVSVCTRGTSLVLQCASSDEARAWMDSLQAAVLALSGASRIVSSQPPQVHVMGQPPSAVAPAPAYYPQVVVPGVAVAQPATALGQQPPMAMAIGRQVEGGGVPTASAVTIL